MNKFSQKKFWIALVAVITLLVTTVPMIFAQSGTNPTFTVAFTDEEGNALTSAHTGDEIYVTASVENLQSETKIYSLDYAVFFDDSQIETSEGLNFATCLNKATGAPLSLADLVLLNESDASFLMGVASTGGLTDNGILYQVPVTVKDTAVGTLKLEQLVKAATIGGDTSTIPAIGIKDTSTSNKVTVIPTLESISAPDQVLAPNETYTPSEVTATYVNGQTALLSEDDVTFTPENIDTTDSAVWGTTIPVTATYTEDGVKKMALYNVTVEKGLESIAVKDDQTTITLDINDVYMEPTIVATYSDGTTAEVNATFDTTPDTSNAGTTKITATYTENGVTETCQFDVVVKALESISVPKESMSVPLNGAYTPQEVTATYTDGSTAIIDAAQVNFTTVDLTKVGKTTVSVSYTEAGIEKTTSYEVTVYAGVSKIEASDVSLKVGDTYEVPDVTATYTDGSTKDVTADTSFDPETVDTSKDNTGSPVTVTATYMDDHNNTVDTTFTVTVEKELASISVPKDSLSIPLNGTYTPQAVTATYTNSTSHTVMADFNPTTINTAVAGTTTVNVSYTEAGIEKTTEYDVIVYTGVSKIEASDVSLKVGDTYKVPDVTATYTDGTTKDVTADTSFDPETVDTSKDNTASPVTVTATYKDEHNNTVDTTFTVTVEKELSSISVPKDSLSIPLNGDYTPQEVTATYTDGSTAIIDADQVDFTSVDLTKAGTITVTVSYKEAGIEKTTSYDVTVYTGVSKIEASDVSLKVGDTYEVPVVTATYTDGSTKDVTADTSFDPETVDTSKDNAASPVTVKATYKDEHNNTVDTTFTVTVEKELASISVAEDSLNIAQNATYTPQEVTATYTDGSKKVVTATFDQTVDTSVVGTTTVDVSYEEDSIKVTTNYDVNVYAFVKKIEANNVTLKVGETYEVPEVTATDSNGDTKKVTASFDPETVDTSKDNTASPVTVTATYTDQHNNTVTTTFTVTVEKELDKIGVPKDSLYYIIDETFVPQTVTATYTDGTEEVVNATMTPLTVDMSQVGTTDIMLSYTYDGIEKTTTYKVIVANKVKIDQSVSKNVKQGETPDLDGQVFTGVLIDKDGNPILDEETGEQKTFTITYDASKDMQILNFDPNTVGTQTYDIMGVDENGDAFILKDAVEITVEESEEISSDTTDTTTTEKTDISQTTDNANTGVEEKSNTPMIIALIIIALLAVGFLIYRQKKQNKK